MANILLVGCGALGRQLAVRLLAAEHTVFAVKRSPLKSPVMGLQVVLADITVAQDVKKLPTDVDIVVFILSPSKRNEAAYQTLYGSGVSHVLNHFARAPLPASGLRPRCLLVSSTSVYGQENGEWVDEGSPTQASRFNGKALLQAEQQLWAHCANNIVIRFSGIYGPGRESLLRRVREGKPVQYAPPYFSNRIHEEDCLGILCFLIARALADKPLENLYLASDSTPIPQADVALWLSELMSCPPPPAKPENLTLAKMNKRCRNDRLLRLGYVLRYPSYRHGYAELLEAI